MGFYGQNKHEMSCNFCWKWKGNQLLLKFKKIFLNALCIFSHQTYICFLILSPGLVMKYVHKFKEGTSFSLDCVRLKKKIKKYGSNYMFIHPLFLYLKWLCIIYFTYEQNKLKIQKPMATLRNVTNFLNHGLGEDDFILSFSVCLGF